MPAYASTYTSAAAIAAYLGETFTAAQTQLADAVAVAVTAFVDRYCAQTWQAFSPIAGEIGPIIARRDDGADSTVPSVYLQHRPAVAVSAVRTRSSSPPATVTVLTASQWELIDPPNGVLRLASAGAAVDQYGSLLAVVDYTYADAVPADVALAATMIGASEMARILSVQEESALVAAHPELAVLKSVAVGQNDVNVTLADTAAAAGATDAGSSWVTPGSAVAAILAGYRRMVIA